MLGSMGAAEAAAWRHVIAGQGAANVAGTAT
jgi:hypothetical protein